VTWIHGYMLTGQMLTGYMLTGQLLTGRMLTLLSKNRTIAHKRPAGDVMTTQIFMSKSSMTLARQSLPVQPCAKYLSRLHTN